jgi:hypothetical protein
MLAALKGELKDAEAHIRRVEAEKLALVAKNEAADARAETQKVRAELEAHEAKAAAQVRQETAVREARQADKEAADAKYEELRVATEKARVALEEQLASLRAERDVQTNRIAELEQGAASGKKRARKSNPQPKKRRGNEDPTDEVAQAFVEDGAGAGAGEGEGEGGEQETIVEGPFAKPRPKAERPWTFEGCGADHFLQTCKIVKRGDFKKLLWNEAKWVEYAMDVDNAPWNQGLAEGEVAQLPRALAIMADGPWIADGTTFKNKMMFMAHLLWPELGVDGETEKLDEEKEIEKRATYQLKKVVCGISQVAEAYNLYMEGSPGYERINKSATAGKISIRNKKPMRAIDNIKAAKGKPGFEALRAASLAAPAAAPAAPAAPAAASAAPAAPAAAPAPAAPADAPADAPAAADADADMTDAAPTDAPADAPADAAADHVPADADLDELAQPTAEDEMDTEPEAVTFAKGDEVHFVQTLNTKSKVFTGFVDKDDNGEDEKVRVFVNETQLSTPILRANLVKGAPPAPPADQ